MILCNRLFLLADPVGLVVTVPSGLLCACEMDVSISACVATSLSDEDEDDKLLDRLKSPPLWWPFPRRLKWPGFMNSPAGASQ